MSATVYGEASPGESKAASKVERVVASPVAECERLHRELLDTLAVRVSDRAAAERLHYLAAMASELRLRVEREAGRLLTRRVDPGGRPRACEQHPARAVRLALGVDRSTAARLRALASMSETDFERVVDGLWLDGVWPVPRAASGVVRASLGLRAGEGEATSALGDSSEIPQVDAQIETETP